VSGDRIIVETFAGPGGWSLAAARLGMERLAGIELDPAACATRAAAGHRTIRADVARFDVRQLAGRVRGHISSPPCTQFSISGKRAGVIVRDVLADGIGGTLDGREIRAAARREMTSVLCSAGWPHGKMPRAERSEAISRAVRSASLVLEPARLIAASQPEWVALEQVPGVLPLWQAYADGLRARGYSAWAGVVNAADYAVPQYRLRAVLIASRTHAVRCPPAPCSDQRRGAQLWGDPWVSMASAIGWGATDRPAPAVTAGGTATGGAEPWPTRARDMLAAERAAGRWAPHPDGDSERITITVDEAAALQSFPPGYPWRGNNGAAGKGARYRQIGDAVPPLLAAHILSMAAGVSAERLAEATDMTAAAERRAA
jgi:DNA (cytosine-5)-methyltransferase 1